jgi:hypothetical protein
MLKIAGHKCSSVIFIWIEKTDKIPQSGWLVPAKI